MNTDVKLVSELNKSFQDYRYARQKWLNRALEYEMVYHNDVDGTGTQFTQDQLQNIKDKHLIGTSINFTLPIIEVLTAFLTENQPVPDTIPIGNSSKDVSYVYREVIKACLNNNDYAGSLLERVIKDMAISGRGVIQATPSDMYEYNEFNIVLKNLNYKYYYPDPQSKLRSHQDSERIFIATPLSVKKAKSKYGLTDEEIKMATTVIDSESYNNPIIPSVTTQLGNEVWVQEIYEKVQATVYILEGGKRTFTQPKSFIDKQGQLVMGYVDSRHATFVKRIIKIGNFIKSNTILPIELYPIIVFGATHNDCPFEYGWIHNFIDLNYALNNFLALITENAQGSSSGSFIAPTNAIDDAKKFTKDISTPNGIATYNPDKNLPNGGKPERNLPLPISNAFYTLFQICRELIEMVTGMHSLLQGSAQDAPRTEGATNTISSFGLQRPKMYARRIDSSSSLLGKLIIQMYQTYAPSGNILRYISGTQAHIEIITNISAQFEQSEEGTNLARSGLGEGEKMSIINGLAEQKEMVLIGDITQGSYNVVFKSTNNLPTTRAQAVEFLKTLLGRMSSDSLSIAVVEALFKYADIAEADEILRNMSAINQANQQVQAANEQVKEYERQIQVLVKQLEHEILARKEAEIEAKVETEKVKIDTVLDVLEKDKKEKEQAKKKKQAEYS